MSRAERLLAALVCASVLFSPVFLGGVGRFSQDWDGRAPNGMQTFLWAHGPWVILSGLAILTAVAAAVVARERAAAGEPPVWRLHGPLVLPLAGLALLGLLQCVPLPRWLLSVLSPGAARELEALLPGDAAWRPLSLWPAGTGAALGGLAMGGAALVGALLVARRRGGALLLAGAVVAAFAGSAAYGLAETYLGGDRVLGFPKGEDLGVTGTFQNRSTLGGGLALALPMGLALAVHGAGWMRTGGGAAARMAAALAGVAAAILLATVPLTGSRGGLAAGALSVLLVALLAARAVRWPVWARAALVLVALASVGAGVHQTLERLPELRRRFQLGMQESGFFDVRFPAWAATVDLAARYPVTGTGLGSYEVAIHETQRPENPEDLVHAHNEPLQALAEGGVPGLVLAVLAAAGALAAALRAAGHGDPLVRALGCGAGAGLGALLAGSLFEFHFHIPALGIAAAVTAALPAAAAAGAPGPVPAAVPGRGVVGISGCLLALAALPLLLRHSDAASLAGAAERGRKGRDWVGWRIAAARWVDADPRDAAARRSLAEAHLGDWSAPDLPERGALALAEADRAVDLEPFHAYGHWARAQALTVLRRFDEVEPAVARARRRAGGIDHLHRAAGEFLYRLSNADPARLPAALDALRAAGEIAPRHFSEAFAIVSADTDDPAVLEALVPPRAVAWSSYAAWCRRNGHGEREVRALARAAHLEPEGGRARGRCLEAARTHGLEALAESLLAGEGP